MVVMTFVTICSPSLAQYIKNVIAKIGTNIQELFNAIFRNHYVDDFLDSVDTISEVI